MSWYIAIQNYYDPVSQHGIASYVTNFESQSLRLRSNFGVAFAQQESCWRSQQSAFASKSKSRGKGMAKLWQLFWAGKQTAVLCLCKLHHWKQRLADWTGSPSVKGKLVQAASFWTFLCKRSCSMPAASLRKLDSYLHNAFDGMNARMKRVVD